MMLGEYLCLRCATPGCEMPHEFVKLAKNRGASWTTWRPETDDCLEEFLLFHGECDIVLANAKRPE